MPAQTPWNPRYEPSCSRCGQQPAWRVTSSSDPWPQQFACDEHLDAVASGIDSSLAVAWTR